ncbi:MAG: radical SAM protein [Verrucomicrobiae bacterium]|nr:radical SAM protein [Verrucomicrobiae bacterium]
MKKVLLISLKKNHFPFSIAHLTPCLTRNGISYDVLDLQFEDDLDARIVSGEYFAVAISAMSLDNYQVKHIFERVMQINPSIKKILGGRIHICPERLLKIIPFDYMVIGDADPTFPELLHAIDAGETNMLKVSGIAFWHEGALVRSQVRVQPKLENFFPRWSDFKFHAYLRLPMHPFFIYKGYPVVSSIGCVGNCTYCNPGYRTVRMRPINEIIQEMKFAVNEYGVTSFNFVSEIFFLTKKTLLEFSDQYQKTCLVLPWRCSVRPDFNPEYAEILATAGCNAVMIGMEAYDDQALKRINKHANTEMLDRLVTSLRNNDISVTCTVMVGNPGDSEESITKSINFCIKHKADPTMNVLQIYPGTDVYDEALNTGRIQNEEEFFNLACTSKITPGHTLYPNMTTMSDADLCRVISQSRGKIERYLLEQMPLVRRDSDGECRCVHCNQLIETKLLRGDFTFTCHKCQGFGYVTQYGLFVAHDPSYTTWNRAMREARRLVFCGNCRFLNTLIREAINCDREMQSIAVIDPRSLPDGIASSFNFDSSFLNSVGGTEYDNLEVIFERYYLGEVMFISFDQVCATDTIIFSGLLAPSCARNYFRSKGIASDRVMNATPVDYKTKCESYFNNGQGMIVSNSLADLIWFGEKMGKGFIADSGNDFRLAIAATGKYGLFMAAGCRRAGAEVRIIDEFCITPEIEHLGFQVTNLKDASEWSDAVIVMTPDRLRQELIWQLIYERSGRPQEHIVRFTNLLYERYWKEVLV